MLTLQDKILPPRYSFIVFVEIKNALCFGSSACLWTENNPEHVLGHRNNKRKMKQMTVKGKPCIKDLKSEHKNMINTGLGYLSDNKLITEFMVQ